MPRQEIRKGLIPDLSDVETPAERYMRLDEEREIIDPPISSARGVEYYTGEFYGDN